MLPQNKPDRIRILFDDHRLVANAGLLLPATLARHLGLRELVDHHLDLGGAPGRANTGDKMLTLVASALAGGDCIDDAETTRVHIQALFDLRPSMGPPPFGDGNGATAKGDVQIKSVLQWGHRLSAMETALFFCWSTVSLLLQWGHRLSAMETPPTT